MLKSVLLASTLGLLALNSTLASAAMAEGITLRDAYVRVSGAMAKSGAAFMVIENAGAEADRLVAARSDVAAKVELHTHKHGADGVMQMVEVPEGFAIPAGGAHELARGGDHVMFLGLTRPLAQGDVVQVTLSFEKAGDVAVEIPVDLTRDTGGMMPGAGHGGANHGHDGAGHKMPEASN